MGTSGMSRTAPAQRGAITWHQSPGKKGPRARQEVLAAGTIGQVYPARSRAELPLEAARTIAARPRDVCSPRNEMLRFGNAAARAGIQRRCELLQDLCA